MILPSLLSANRNHMAFNLFLSFQLRQESFRRIPRFVSNGGRRSTICDSLVEMHFLTTRHLEASEVRLRSTCSIHLHTCTTSSTASSLDNQRMEVEAPNLNSLGRAWKTFQPALSTTHGLFHFVSWPLSHRVSASPRRPTLNGERERYTSSN